jgi:transcriptional regulator with XRE-family HTH domain
MVQQVATLVHYTAPHAYGGRDRTGGRDRANHRAAYSFRPYRSGLDARPTGPTFRGESTDAINVEQGTTNPSIATLLRISDALGIGLPSLVDTAEDTAAPITLHRAGEAHPVWRSPAGGSAVLVAGTRPPNVSELWDWRLGPGDIHPSEAHRAGTRELLLVLSGAIILVVGDTRHRLKVGDSASFDGALPTPTAAVPDSPIAIRPVRTRTLPR